MARDTRDTVEVRFDAPRDEINVLDGYCQAHGMDRTTVMRKILREWSKVEHHRAIVICRVAGINPVGPDTDRST